MKRFLYAFFCLLFLSAMHKILPETLYGVVALFSIIVTIILILGATAKVAKEHKDRISLQIEEIDGVVNHLQHIRSELQKSRALLS